MKTKQARALKASIAASLGERVRVVVQVATFAHDSAFVEVYEPHPGGLIITYWDADDYSLNELCELLGGENDGDDRAVLGPPDVVAG